MSTKQQHKPEPIRPTVGVRASMHEAGPYVRALQGRPLVVHLPGDMQSNPLLLDHLADLALLGSLGAHVALVHTPAVKESDFPAQPLDEDGLTDWMRRVAESESDTIAALGRALPSVSPKIARGNFVTARPRGVQNGQHSGRMGEIRHLDPAAPRALFNAGFMVLASPVAPSVIGGWYALDSQELAVRLAVETGAAKLIMLVPAITELMAELRGEDSDRTQVLSPGRLRQLADNPVPRLTGDALRGAATACEQGVERVHLLDLDCKGVLVEELYTREGSGALVARKELESMRAAGGEDAAGILQLIEPLEEQDILVRRSREQLEADLEHFVVLEKEGVIVGCCALLPVTPEEFELAALAIAPTYQGAGRASILLAEAERIAHSMGARRLLTLTTVAEEWFQERGFNRRQPGDLPASRAALYNYKRNSIALVKELKQ